MWNLVIWTEDRIPATINAVDTRYCVSSAPKPAPPWPAMMMGGVMMPANMDKACWKPKSRARKMGMLSLRPKKGAALFDFVMNGRLGLNRKA